MPLWLFSKTRLDNWKINDYIKNTGKPKPVH